MLKEAKRLYLMGYTPLWLKSRDKRPINMGWTSAPRPSWPDFERAYRPGMNLGVRLGKVSKVGQGFAAVIDVDVKSKDPRHGREAFDKMLSLFPDLPVDPVMVNTGRGGGSLHVYALTEAPVKPQRLSQSNETVKVHMPSSEPSKRERETLTAEELKKGWRLRPAWEVAIMGDGQQVVAPGSIHPDTGLTYSWVWGDWKVADLGFIKVPVLSSDDKPRHKKEPMSSPLESIEWVEIDPFDARFDDHIAAMIWDGEGVEDRSSTLLIVAEAMIKAGFRDNEVRSVLTDNRTFLGQTAFDHAKTTDRKRALRWFDDYTFKTAKINADPSLHFDDMKIEDAVLSEAEQLAQEAELFGGGDWRSRIERQKDEKPKSTLKNMVLILENSVDKSVIRLNEFANFEIYGTDTPWGGKKGRELGDRDITNIKKWFADNWRFEPDDKKIHDAITFIGGQNRFHPVKTYLAALPEWDGVNRLDGFLVKYFNAKGPSEYLSAVGRKTICAMIARIYDPGCKFDQILILEGNQGIGKSTAVRNLASDAWFSDAHININDKDGVLSMSEVWVFEMGELSGMRKADTDLLKDFISRRVDRIRVPYGRRPERFPRQCIFIGTTNSTEYLKDPTGNRRFWPVEVGDCDFKGIARDRDQLFAEAKLAYELGEPLYLEDREVNQLAIAEQEDRTFDDPWVDLFEQFVGDEMKKPEKERFDINKIRLHDLFAEFGNRPFAEFKANHGELLRAGLILKKLGYKKACRRDAKGVMKKFWVK